MINILEGVQYDKGNGIWQDIKADQRNFIPGMFRVKPVFKATVSVDNSIGVTVTSKEALLEIVSACDNKHKVEILYAAAPKYDAVAKKLQYRIENRGGIMGAWHSVQDINGFSSTAPIEFRIRPDYHYKVTSGLGIAFNPATYFDDAVELAKHFENKITTNSFDSFVVTREKY